MYSKSKTLTQTYLIFAKAWHVFFLDRPFKLYNYMAITFKNGGRGTKPTTYIFVVIIPLLVVELKATPNDNSSNDFYWRQKSSSLNVVQYNISSRPIIIHLQIYIA